MTYSYDGRSGDMTTENVEQRAPKPPCHIDVILAREAPVAVIFRSGPQDWTQIINWNTDSDTFEEGQWFRGRIFDDISDLAPDGTRLIYSVSKYGLKPYRYGGDIGYEWTALSKPPYLTALALWRCTGRRDGGGLFLDNDHIWLNQPQIAPDKGVIPVDLQITFDVDNSSTKDTRRLYLRRLEMGGWKQVSEAPSDGAMLSHLAAITYLGDFWKSFSETLADWTIKYEKIGLHSPHALEQKIYSPHSHFATYIIRKPDGTIVPIVDATWADWDHQGRLAFARAGKLFVVAPDGNLESDAIELADFNANTFTEIEAPEWATKW